ARGHDVVVLARSRGVDVVTGTGLEDGLRGVDVVVDTLNTPSLSRRKAVEFFRTTSHRLLEAGARQGVAHHVVLSIVGIDGIDEPHYAGKLAQERTVQDSEVPHTIARAAQFHEFAAQISARTTIGPLTIAPRMPTRPVAAREVGEHLVRIAEAGPAGRAPDLGGPEDHALADTIRRMDAPGPSTIAPRRPPRPVAAREVGAHLVRIAEADPAGRAPDLVGPEDHALADMIRRMYAHDGTSRRVLEVRFPGAYGRGIASGALRGDPANALVGKMTFTQWLESDPHTHAT